MPIGVDKRQNFRDRGIGACQMPHGFQAFGEQAATVEQLLVKRP